MQERGAARVAPQEHDIVYQISLRFPWDGGLTIKVREYTVTNETAKSLMSDSTRFPKNELDTPIIDAYVGHFYGAKLTMYETTREEVEEYGIPALRKEVLDWLEERAEYYNSRIRELNKQE